MFRPTLKHCPPNSLHVSLGEPDGGVEHLEERRTVTFQQPLASWVAADHLRTTCDISAIVRQVEEQEKAKEQCYKHWCHKISRESITIARESVYQQKI